MKRHKKIRVSKPRNRRLAKPSRLARAILAHMLASRFTERLRFTELSRESKTVCVPNSWSVRKFSRQLNEPVGAVATAFKELERRGSIYYCGGPTFTDMKGKTSPEPDDQNWGLSKDRPVPWMATVSIRPDDLACDKFA